MGFVKYVFQRVSSFDKERFKKHMDVMVENTGKSKAYIKFDWLKNLIIYGVGYTDYFRGNFIELKRKEKKTFVTSKSFYKILQKLNDKEYTCNLRDKIKFNNLFKEFLNRDFIDLREKSCDDFKRFLKDKDVVFAKVVYGYGGHGVNKIEISNDLDIEKTYQTLIENKQFLVEEEIKQHEAVNEINPYSVASFRVVTLLDDSGKPFVIANSFRINQGKNEVVGSSDDMYFALSEDGKIDGNVIDDYGNVYAEHPLTHKKFKDVKVPFVKDAFELCKKASLKLPQVRYIGWDVAISKTGAVLMEGNEYPGYGVIQFYKLKGSRTGHKKQIEDALGHSI